MFRGAGLLVFVALLLVYDSPYAAWATNRLMGTSAIPYVETSGVPTVMILGPDAPRADWVGLPDDALVIGASHIGPTPPRLETGTFDFTTGLDLAGVVAFYKAQLGGQGMVVENNGIAPLNPAAAAYLGIDGALTARDLKTGREARIVIRTEQGWLFPARYVQVVWARTLPGQGPAWPEPMAQLR